MSIYPWHVVRVAPNREFAVRDDMHAVGMPAVVPVQFTHRKVRKDGTVTYRRKPVMPGYVMACFRDSADWCHAIKIRGYKGVIWLDGSPYRLSQASLDSVLMLSKPAQAVRRDHGVKIGDAIRIKRGAHAELSGIVEDISRGKVVARVPLIGGREHRVTLDYDQLHPGS